MKRIISLISLCFIMSMLFSLLAISSAHADPPIEISTCAELQAAPSTGAYQDAYILTEDIDCSGVDFEPLVWDQEFAGSFDGQGFRIFNLTINQPGETAVGLFFTANGASISNLTLIGGSVTGQSAVGAIVGVSNNTSYNYVHSSADVTGSNSVGGLFGEFQASGEVVYMEHSSSSGTVSGGDMVGGLSGSAFAFGDGAGANIRYSFSTGEVIGTDPDGNHVGGLVGSAAAGSDDSTVSVNIEDSFSSANVTATSMGSVGGLVGSVQLYGPNDWAGSFEATNTYASGNVVGDLNVGGLIGYGGMINVPAQNTTISNSFAVGEVTGNSATAGLVGYVWGNNHDVISTNNFWDDVSTGQGSCMTGAAASTCTAVDAVGPDAGYFFDFANEPFSGEWDNGGDPWYEHAYGLPTLVGDDDFDGISSEVEGLAPYDGDGNQDGTQDRAQENVASGPNGTDGNYFTLAVDEEYELFDVESLEDMDIDLTQATHEFPYGLVWFKVLTEPGDNVAIELTFHSVHEDDGTVPSVVKYDYTAHSFTEVDPSGVQADGDEIILTYTLTEGGEYDQDQTENGILEDPVGLGFASPAATPTTTPAQGPVGATGTLPATGNNGSSQLMFAGVILALGLLTTACARKRRRFL